MVVKEGAVGARFQALRNNISIFGKRKSVKYGIPFLLFIVGGSFGLREWTQIRYQFAKVKGVSREDAEKMGLNRPNEVTLEKAYDEIQKLDIDNWENKRGPRPWEEAAPTKK